MQTEKELVILARVYDENSLEVVTKFTDMPVCNVGTAEIFMRSWKPLWGECIYTIKNALKARLNSMAWIFKKNYLSDYDRNGGIPWDNLVAFNSDNCSVMKGKHHSVITKLRASQPYVQDVGCICHLAQLVTGCGVKAIKRRIYWVVCIATSTKGQYKRRKFCQSVLGKFRV